ncbi:MAG: GWxTD domain-containing protein, partial [Bacteroidota bacterium]|nr:GWxTD domain-containing protein [Bacteroidota bacterium]
PNYTDLNTLLAESFDDGNLLLTENNYWYYKFNVPVTKNETLVVLKVLNQLNNTEYWFDIPVDLPLQFTKSPLLLMERGRDIPIFSDFVSLQDSIRIISLKEEIEQVYFFHYSQNFAPADPPMNSRATAIEKEMEIDSAAMILVNQNFILPAKGLYFFQHDTTSAQGISFIATDNYFPQFVKAETLVEPIIYISTSREIRKVRDIEDKKKAMDTYWLELTKSPDRSRKIIRDYYRQIELANYLFTNYKEGWKTDRGMILTLFGKPDAVFSNGEIEEWIYERRGSMSRINFNFVKIKNVFSDDHYELVRNPGFDREWFRIVDQWRKGRQEI